MHRDGSTGGPYGDIVLIGLIGGLGMGLLNAILSLLLCSRWSPGTSSVPTSIMMQMFSDMRQDTSACSAFWE